MSAIVLPEFVARTSSREPLAQAATFVSRRTDARNVSAGSIQHPRYRIRFAPSPSRAVQQGAGPVSAVRGHQAGVFREAGSVHSPVPAVEYRQVEPLEKRETGSCRLPALEGGSGCSDGRFRLTRRGRLVFRGLPLLTLAVLVALGALTFTFPAQAKGGQYQLAEPVSQTITVYHGDSLWSIAEQIAPGYDSRDVINRIMQINDLTSAQVQPGQVLEVPIYSE